MKGGKHQKIVKKRMTIQEENGIINETTVYPFHQKEGTALERYLLIAEVSQKQGYIFGSNKLQENIQRSAEIRLVTEEAYFKLRAPGLYAPGNMVYSGGGHTVLEFAAREQAKSFAEKLTRSVQADFPGMEMFVKIMPWDAEKTPSENIKQLTKELEAKKSRRASAFHQEAFGLGMDTIKRETSPEIENLLQQQAYDPSPLQLVNNFAQISRNGFIAVVHADGNAMGARIEELYKDKEKYAAGESGWQAYRKTARAFSESIDRDFSDALDAVIEKVRAKYTALLEQDPAQSDVLPIRKVIQAGDDICFVCDGDIGVDCCAELLKILSEKKNEIDGKPYAACGGVALVHTKYPFHKAYDTAEDLCSSAKKYGRMLDADSGISAIDWHIEYGQIERDFRESYVTADGNQLNLRPLTVVDPAGKSSLYRRYALFRQLTLDTQNEQLSSRSKLKQLREAMKAGEAETIKYISFNNMNQLTYVSSIYFTGLSDTKDWKGSVFVACGPDDHGKKRTLLYDAIELADHYQTLEGGKRE